MYLQPKPTMKTSRLLSEDCQASSHQTHPDWQKAQYSRSSSPHQRRTAPVSGSPCEWFQNRSQPVEL